MKTRGRYGVPSAKNRICGALCASQESRSDGTAAKDGCGETGKVVSPETWQYAQYGLVVRDASRLAKPRDKF